MKNCPLCKQALSVPEAEQVSFRDAMEWYFKRDETTEWQEYQEWKNNLSNKNYGRKTVGTE